MADATESQLAGDVSPQETGGVIRYRIWPAKRHPLRLVLVLAVVLGATIATGALVDSVFWAVVVFVGLCCAAVPFFFPTEVAMDGGTLNIRQLGTPRTYPLSSFVRLEIHHDVLPRIELLTRARLSPVDRLQGVTIPLPSEKLVADHVVMHARRWVGRRPTGRFAIDGDHAPEDSIVE